MRCVNELRESETGGEHLGEAQHARWEGPEDQGALDSSASQSEHPAPRGMHREARTSAQDSVFLSSSCYLQWFH